MDAPLYQTMYFFPVHQELFDDAEAAQHNLIKSVNPMMSEARLEYWIRRGGWSAFRLFQMRIQDRR